MRARRAAILVPLVALLVLIAPSSPALNAAVTWRVDHTAKTITVTARIAVYIVPPPATQLQTQRYLEALTRIEAAIEGPWNGKMFKCYKFVVDAQVRGASGPSDVQSTEFPVRLDTSLVPRTGPRGMEHRRSYVRVAGNDSDNYLSDDPQWDPRTGPTDTPSVWALTGPAGVYAHEFGHLLGLDDNYVEDTRELRQGAADDIMYRSHGAVLDQTIVKAIRRSGEVDEALIKCPLDIRLERSETNLFLLTLGLEVIGCAPDYEPSSTDPNRPGQVVFSGDAFYTGSYLEAFPEIPFRVTERGGAVSFVSTWRQPELDVKVSLGPGGDLRQGVFTKRVSLMSRPDPVTLHNSGGVLALGNIMEITPRDTPCP